MTFNQKETALLKDLVKEEKLCAEKYAKYKEEAFDKQLSQMFCEIEKTEQGHYNTLCELQNGKIPKQMQAKKTGNSSSSSKTSKSSKPSKPTQTYTKNCNSESKQRDAYLCSDSLATEKRTAALYNTCIFEFRDPKVREFLNGIQTAEQNHGEEISEYMMANNMMC